MVVDENAERLARRNKNASCCGKPESPPHRNLAQLTSDSSFYASSSTSSDDKLWASLDDGGGENVHRQTPTSRVPAFHRRRAGSPEKVEVPRHKRLRKRSKDDRSAAISQQYPTTGLNRQPTPDTSVERLGEVIGIPRMFAETKQGVRKIRKDPVTKSDVQIRVIPPSVIQAVEEDSDGNEDSDGEEKTQHQGDTVADSDSDFQYEKLGRESLADRINLDEFQIDILDSADETIEAMLEKADRLIRIHSSRVMLPKNSNTLKENDSYLTDLNRGRNWNDSCCYGGPDKPDRNKSYCPKTEIEDETEEDMDEYDQIWEDVTKEGMNGPVNDLSDLQQRINELRERIQRRREDGVGMERHGGLSGAAIPRRKTTSKLKDSSVSGYVDNDDRRKENVTTYGKDERDVRDVQGVKGHSDTKSKPNVNGQVESKDEETNRSYFVNQDEPTESSSDDEWREADPAETHINKDMGHPSKSKWGSKTKKDNDDAFTSDNADPGAKVRNTSKDKVYSENYSSGVSETCASYEDGCDRKTCPFFASSPVSKQKDCDRQTCQPSGQRNFSNFPVKKSKINPSKLEANSPKIEINNYNRYTLPPKEPDDSKPPAWLEEKIVQPPCSDDCTEICARNQEPASPKTKARGPRPEARAVESVKETTPREDRQKKKSFSAVNSPAAVGGSSRTNRPVQKGRQFPKFPVIDKPPAPGQSQMSGQLTSCQLIGQSQKSSQSVKTRQSEMTHQSVKTRQSEMSHQSVKTRQSEMKRQSQMTRQSERTMQSEMTRVHDLSLEEKSMKYLVAEIESDEDMETDEEEDEEIETDDEEDEDGSIVLSQGVRSSGNKSNSIQSSQLGKGAEDVLVENVFVRTDSGTLIVVATETGTKVPLYKPSEGESLEECWEPGDGPRWNTSISLRQPPIHYPWKKFVTSGKVFDGLYFMSAVEQWSYYLYDNPTMRYWHYEGMISGCYKNLECEKRMPREVFTTLAALFILSLIAILGDRGGAAELVLVLCAIYPIYKTAQMMNGNKSSTEGYHWIGYWISYYLLCLDPEAFDFLTYWWLPFRQVFKFILLVWIMVPREHRPPARGLASPSMGVELGQNETGKFIKMKLIPAVKSVINSFLLWYYSIFPKKEGKPKKPSVKGFATLGIALLMSLFYVWLEHYH